MDWKRARRPITKYTFPFLQSSLRAENVASGKKPRKLRTLATAAVLELTKGICVVWASTVNNSVGTPLRKRR